MAIPKNIPAVPQASNNAQNFSMSEEERGRRLSNDAYNAPQAPQSNTPTQRASRTQESVERLPVNDSALSYEDVSGGSQSVPVSQSRSRQPIPVPQSFSKPVQEPLQQQSPPVQEPLQQPPEEDPDKEKYVTDPKTGKTYKKMPGIASNAKDLNAIKRMGDNFGLSEMRAMVEQDEDFSNADTIYGGDLNDLADTFLSHLRVPPDEREIERLRELKAKQKIEQDKLYDSGTN